MTPFRTPRPAAIAALAVVAALALSACQPADASGQRAPGQVAVSTKPPTKPSTEPSAGPAGTSTPTPDATPTATPSPPPPPVVDPALRFGMKGDAVEALQQQLTDLGYWAGPIDGKFGDATRQAVWALQSAGGRSMSGVTDKATWALIHAGTRPKARSRSGTVIEIDLKRGLVIFVKNGHVNHVLHTSTGGGYTYTSEGVTSQAITPKGHFSTYRVVDGPDVAPLGLLWRPRYFTGGVAIHGDSSVPKTPVSHGCVRVSDGAMDWVWAQNLDPIGTSVWVY